MKGDFLVRTANPAALDRTLQQVGAVLLGGPDYIQHDGCYVARPLPADNGFPRFACERQGYAEVIGLAPEPAPWDVKEPTT